MPSYLCKTYPNTLEISALIGNPATGHHYEVSPPTVYPYSFFPNYQPQRRRSKGQVAGLHTLAKE